MVIVKPSSSIETQQVLVVKRDSKHAPIPLPQKDEIPYRLTESEIYPDLEKEIENGVNLRHQNEGVNNASSDIRGEGEDVEPMNKITNLERE